MDILITDMRFDIKMAAGRGEVHEEEVCTYCTTTAFEGGVVVVVFIVRPTGLHARACLVKLKHHNTAKVLLGIAPQGVGKAKLVTNINKLTPGDILADGRI